MLINLEEFERICRRAHIVNERGSSSSNLHPFEERNVHQVLPKKVQKLFDDGYFSEATFEALKFLDKKIQKLSGLNKTGYQLMTDAFHDKNGSLKLNSLIEQSDIDEQRGYMFIFAGIMTAIRNPKGHEYEIEDDPDTCLDHLVVISALIRRLEEAGYSLAQ